MNWLDIVLIVLLLIPTITGLKQGIVKGILSLAGLIIGIMLAGKYYTSASGLFSFTDNTDLANILGFVLILIVVIIVANVIAFLLQKIVNATTLGWVDHTGGAIFGLFSGFLTLGAILAIIVKYFGTEPIAESFIAQVMLDYFPVVLGLLPSDFESIQEFFQT